MTNIPQQTEKLAVHRFLEYCTLSGACEGCRCCGPRAPSIPLVDVRSPGEYQQGHIPGAINLPLFSDIERAEVGTVYRHQGADAAILLGLRIVGPKMEGLALRAREIAGPGREAAMYCSRGGMRSGSMAWLFGMAGVRCHVLEGGYKAFRRYVLSFLAEDVAGHARYRLLVLGGGTGSGKTETLHGLAALGAQVLDLEGMARHRGSAFGAVPGEDQPSYEHFENRVAVALAQCDPARPVWVEDESENIGSINQPRPFYGLLRQSSLVVLDVPRERRLERVLAEYSDLPREYMEQAVDRIRKRLGGQEHKRAHAALAEGDLPTLAEILLDYYDRAYNKQILARPVTARVEAVDAEQAVKLLLEAASNTARHD